MFNLIQRQSLNHSTLSPSYTGDDKTEINRWAESCGSEAIRNTFGRIAFIMINGVKVERQYSGSKDDELRQVYKYFQELCRAYKEKNPGIPDGKIEKMVSEVMRRQAIDVSTVSGMTFVGELSGQDAHVQDLEQNSRFEIEMLPGEMTVHKKGTISVTRDVGRGVKEPVGQFDYTTTTHMKPGDEESETWTETLETKKK